jgi:tRNA 2-selenouridine synthase SelU
MSRQCTICRSEHRAAVELGLVSGVSQQVLADRYSLSRDAIKRHARAHLSPSQAAAILLATQPNAIDLEQLTETEGSSLLANLVCQRARLSQLAERAVSEGELGVANALERTILVNLEVVGKLLSKFVMRHESRTINVCLTPEYTEVRRLLTRVLARFPDAQRAVADEIRKIEANAVEAMMAPTKQIEHEHASAPN